MKTAIYTAPIERSTRGNRREAEVCAANRLITDVFGASARLSHYADGAPYVVTHPDVCISISHCIDECVLAVSDSSVGVDIETARPMLEHIATKFLMPAEQSRGPHSLTVLMQMWSAKEAVFKCARIPSLVVSAIEVSSDLTMATVCHDGMTRRFAVTYPRLTTTHVIALAREVF